MNVERFATYVYPLFRFVFGVMFLFHGLQKFGLIGGHTVPMVSRLGAAAVVETVCGAFIAAGAFTRLAAFVASGEMAFAYFTSLYPRGFWPIQNQGELAVLYCFAFLYIAVHGVGRFGFDKR